MYARPFIDSLDFAGNARQISGEAPVAELPRLLDALENSQGILKYTVRGGVDKQGIPRLDVSISGNCQLRCQRCLGAMEHVVRIDTRLLLRDQASLDALDSDVAGGEEEEFDSILADTHLDVLDMLEEEVLLSLPIAPKHELGHELGACQAAGGENKPLRPSLPQAAQDRHEEERNPFAALAKLKRSA
ncbi:MAG: YceD family protein [Sideroxyarcus sp.]|nr:YceD family protein [Sideroxyarcus sp.]